MCGRFAASASTDTYVEVFGIDEVVEDPEPHYNLAPTDPVPAVVDRLGEAGSVTRKLVQPRWGLVPSWAADARAAARLINARFETVAEKPSFRKAFAARRCLIPADGYYEWFVLPGQESVKRPRKQPYFIHPASGLLVMAGLYEFWRGPAGEWLTTATIITTSATDALGHLHDRMPMTVQPSLWDAWLDPTVQDPAVAASLLCVDETLDAHPVSDAVGNVRHDSPDLVRPVAGRSEA